MTRRKIIYSVIYVGVVLAFPALPLKGLEAFGSIVKGAMDGMGGMIKDRILETLNPFK